MGSGSNEQYCNPQGCKIVAGGRRPPGKRASSAAHPEGVLSSSRTPPGRGMIFPIRSGGLATTGYSLAALRAANFLGNSISGDSRCFQIIRPGAQGEEIKIRLQIIGGPWRQELESETLSRKLFL